MRAGRDLCSLSEGKKLAATLCRLYISVFCDHGELRERHAFAGGNGNTNPRADRPACQCVMSTGPHQQPIEG